MTVSQLIRELSERAPNAPVKYFYNSELRTVREVITNEDEHGLHVELWGEVL